MSGANERGGIDVGLVVCIGAALTGLLASTGWVISVPGSIAPLGIIFLLGGVGVCYLGITVRESTDDPTLEESPP